MRAFIDLVGLIEDGKPFIAQCQSKRRWSKSAVKRLRTDKFLIGLVGRRIDLATRSFFAVFVGVTLHIGGRPRPPLFVDQVHDQALQLDRALDLILRLAEDDLQHLRLFARGFEHVAIVRFQLVAVAGREARAGY